MRALHNPAEAYRLSPFMRDATEIRRQANAIRVQFISIELDLAMTFVSVAADEGLQSPQRVRNHRQARVAYDTAVRFLAGAELSLAERAEFECKLRRIKISLQEIGLAAA